MEINESEDTELCPSNLGDSLDNPRLSEAHTSSHYDLLSPAEALLDTFLEKTGKDVSPSGCEKEGQKDQIDHGTTPKKNTKDSPETEKQTFFHLSANMKKDLSMLTFPSKPQSRKKGIISNRTIPLSRITIAEALEKAKDARNSITNLHVTSDKPQVKEMGIPDQPSPSNSHDTVVDKLGKESINMTGQSADTEAPETNKIRVKKFESTVTSESVAVGSPPSDATVNESASNVEGKSVLLAGKKPSGSSRVKMTRRMWELLQFTFIHEHFPSSVHMARMAKMMGVPWAQVRNWFTDRRVDNKKAGLYPRDRVYSQCPYCNVHLKTEAEQKGHLFSTSHVKKVLGSEYCGGVSGGTSESIKWKKLPQTVNAVSSVSGARILAVGFSADDFKKGKKVPEKKKMETAVGKPANSKEMKKLWTEAMLLPEEKEQPPPEWDHIRVGVEKSLDSHHESYVQQKKETVLKLKKAPMKEKVLEHSPHESGCDRNVVITSRVVSIPVGDMIPGNVSDNAPITVNSATTTTNTAASSWDSDVANTSDVSPMMVGDLHTKKRRQSEDLSVVSEVKVSKKILAFEKKQKINTGSVEESETQKPLTLSAELLRKAYKNNFPGMKTKNKSSSSRSGFSNLSNIAREKKSLKSPLFNIEDFEFKQEDGYNDSRINNITLYKGDASDGQNKYEIAVASANKQPLTVTQNVPSSVKSVQVQKSSLVVHDTTVGKSKSGLAVNKIARFSMDKRKDKVRAQPLGSVLRANKAALLAYEGNIIVGYQCPNCNKVYQTEWLMMKHSVTHFKYHCDICYQVYPTESMMKIHLLDHLTGAYEEEKYYCQFSCKICHSLKCGCLEPTYCKPQDLPRLYVRPQKARRSKKGFITKLNSGPNDHLKISLSSYKKLLLSESVGNSAKSKPEKSSPQKPPPLKPEKSTSLKPPLLKPEKSTSLKPPLLKPEKSTSLKPEKSISLKPPLLKPEKSTSLKPPPAQDAKKIFVQEDDQKASSTSTGDPQKSTVVLKEFPKAFVLTESPKTFIMKESPKSNTPTEPPKVPSVEANTPDLITIKEEVISPIIPTTEKDLDNVASVSGEQTEIKSNVSEAGKKLTLAKEKQKNWRRIKRKLTMNYESEVTSSPLSSAPNKPEETGEAPSTKRAGSRRRTTKQSSTFGYNDTDFYYMCEICDASFTSKPELSEHMFLHRLKSRSRGEKRGVAWVTEEKVPKKVKLPEVKDPPASQPISSENHVCELCHSIFATAADCCAHKVLVHNESPPQKVEVFRCNYCDKIYRRRRELKRHLKRDCSSAPSSLKGKLSTLSSSNNVIEETHYTTVKIDFDDKLDGASRCISRGGARGPIVCKYCLAVTKREAEMKRHIWKFCLKVPPEVVRKFMDGASLEELGFKFISDRDSTTDGPQNIHTGISGTQSVADAQNVVEDCLGEMLSIKHPGSSTESSPEKGTSLDLKSHVHLELPETSSSVQHSPQMLPAKEVSSVKEDTSQGSNIAKKKKLTVEEVFDESDTEKSEMETSDVQPVTSENQSLSVVHAEESTITDEREEEFSTKSPSKIDEPADQKSPTKSLSEETNLESSCGADEGTQSAASTSPLASPVMQFPIVIPVMTASQKSKRPLVCGYCGIWYFREMAILKHMKERCIKIPEFEKNFLRKNSSICNVTQKSGGVDIAAENGAVYKMVKMPEHMQHSPVLIPKDVTNEDIKELNTNIKAYSESTPTESKPIVNKQVDKSSASPAVTPIRSTPGKRGSRCRRCHEHFSSQEAVLAHSSVHHGPKKGFYKCKLCQARLAKYKQLREHVWEHTNENPYRCHLCEVRYRSSDDLVEHLLKVHRYTSINDKNLYKWLPGRHGKYRDIKTKNSNCEEKLDDVDTNLDSHAEVMVITDQDLSSNKTSDSRIKEITQESNDKYEQLHQSENLQMDSICNEESSSENKCKSSETKSPPSSLDATNNSGGTGECNTMSGDTSADKMDTLSEGKRNREESLGKIECGSSSPAVKKESQDQKQTCTTESVTCESESGLEQDGVTVSEGADNDKDTECGMDGFTGEGLLPLVDNLDSVVETIQLTDQHLS